MLIILVVEGLEHILKVAILLNHNSYAKVVANRAKIYYFKFTIELLFKGINGSSTANNLNIIYID